jgi:hypothetical protein
MIVKADFIPWGSIATILWLVSGSVERGQVSALLTSGNEQQEQETEQRSERYDERMAV